MSSTTLAYPGSGCHVISPIILTSFDVTGVTTSQKKKNGTSTQGLCSSYRYDVDNISIQMHIRHHGIIFFFDDGKLHGDDINRKTIVLWLEDAIRKIRAMAYRFGQRKEKYRTLLPKTRDVR